MKARMSGIVSREEKEELNDASLWRLSLSLQECSLADDCAVVETVSD